MNNQPHLISVSKALLLCLGLIMSVTGFGQEVKPGDVIWEFGVGKVESSPTIGSDGTIYFVAIEKFYALNPEGTKKWEFKSPYGGDVPPAIGSDGTIYLGGDRNLYAIDPNGSLKWAFKREDFGRKTLSPSIGIDGTVYVASTGGDFYAINLDGTKKWKYITAPIESSTAIGIDGTIYFCSKGNILYALNSDGTQKWSLRMASYLNNSPAIASDGTVYVATRNGLYSIDPDDGALKWSFRLNLVVYSSPVVGNDGTIYVGSLDENLYAIKSDGTKKWVFKTGGSVWSSPAIGNDGTIYFGSTDKKIYAINPDGGEEWTFETAGAVLFSPVIGNNGTIYIGSGRTFYAIKTSSTGPANSPWPMYGQNAQRTGRAPEPVPDQIQITIPDKTASPFTVSFTTAEDSTYVFQASGDLKNWSKVEEVKGTGGEVKVTDWREAIFQKQYYRVKLVE